MQKLIKGSGIHVNFMNQILAKVGAKNDEYTENQFIYFCQLVGLFQQSNSLDLSIK